MPTFTQSALTRRTFLSAAAAIALLPATGLTRQATPIPQASPVAGGPDEVAYARGGEVWMMTNTGANARLFLEMPGIVRRLNWSPSGRYLLARSLQPGSIHHHLLIDVETGEQVEAPQQTFWAGDRDELVTLDGMGTSSWGLATLDLTGAEIERYEATTDRDAFCDVNFEPTMILQLAWLAGYARVPYASVVWHVGAQVAYVNTLCDWSVKLDLATGRSSDEKTMMAQMRGDWQLLLFPGPTRSSIRPIVSSIATGDVMHSFETSGGARLALVPDGSLIGSLTSQQEEVVLAGDDNRTYHDNELLVHRWRPGHDRAEHLATVDATSAGVFQVADDESHALLGTLANPSELNRVDRGEGEPEERYRDGFRIERIDLGNGDVETIAKDARLPAIRPSGIGVQATPVG